MIEHLAGVYVLHECLQKKREDSIEYQINMYTFTNNIKKKKETEFPNKATRNKYKCKLNILAMFLRQMHH